jgi:hypothetical protein
VILRIVDDDVATFDIHDWLRNQPEPLGGVPFLMIADAVIDEAQATLDVWIERAIRTLLEEAAVSDTKS